MSQTEVNAAVKLLSFLRSLVAWGPTDLADLSGEN